MCSSPSYYYLLLLPGEAKTGEQTAKYKTDVQHNLANFTLADDEEMNLFEFDGENYKGAKTNYGREVVVVVVG